MSHLPIGQIPVKRDERWVEIDDPNKVAVKMRGTLVTTTSAEIVPGSAKVDGTHMDLIEPDNWSDVGAIPDGSGQGAGPVVAHDGDDTSVDPPG